METVAQKCDIARQLQFVGVQVLPGSQLLASADEQGNIAVKDLRMLGGFSQQPPRSGPHKGLPPPTSPPGAGPGAGSWGAYSGNAAARGLVWEVRGAHQGQGVVRMITGLRPLADGSTGGSSAHYPFLPQMPCCTVIPFFVGARLCTFAACCASPC